MTLSVTRQGRLPREPSSSRPICEGFLQAKKQTVPMRSVLLRCLLTLSCMVRSCRCRKYGEAEELNSRFDGSDSDSHEALLDLFDGTSDSNKKKKKKKKKTRKGLWKLALAFLRVDLALALTRLDPALVLVSLVSKAPRWPAGCAPAAGLWELLS